MNTVSKGWKKYWKQALFQQKALTFFTILLASITVITMPIFMLITRTPPNGVCGGIAFLLTTVIFVFLLIQEMKDIQKYEEEDDACDAYERIADKQEGLYDIMPSIHLLLEKNTDTMTKYDTNFVNELEQLWKDISYIENACILLEKEEEEELIQIHMHWHNVLQTYFDIFPENRKELANELLLKVQGQRKKLRITYIHPHQDTLVQQCKQKAECMEEEKREYLYIQE